jgi:hypothetical protein
MFEKCPSFFLVIDSTANTASMEEIQRNIRLASSNDKHTAWIGGDFNLPEINWEDLDNIHVKENSKKAFHIVSMSLFLFFSMNVSAKASTSLLMES